MAGTNDNEIKMVSSDILTILKDEGVEFLISGEGKVALSSCEGKRVCLFFSANWCRPCKTFIPQLLHLYNILRNTTCSGTELEIIFISLDRDENGFIEHFKCMPWLAVPFDVNLHKRLKEQYGVDRIPSLVAMSSDGIVMEQDLIGMIQDYGAKAFPFTRKRRQELKAIDNAMREGGNLEQLLGHEDGNYLISRDDKKIMLSELTGKTIGLYFGAHWCPPCRAFTAQLTETYNELNTTTDQCPFEVVLISTDRDQGEFNLNISSMPWLAVPYEDKTRQDLCRIFDIKSIPALVLLGADGKMVNADGKAIISLYGAKAFPFTASRIAEIEAGLKKEGDALAKQVKDIKHEHVLNLDMAKAYVCDYCKEPGRFWAFSCDVCDYDLHPTCVEESS